MSNKQLLKTASKERRSVRKTRLNEQGEDEELDAATPAERLAMMWPLTVDAWAFMGEPIDESRLPRNVVRVVRGGR